MIKGKEQILTAFTPQINSEALGQFLDEADQIIIDELAKSFNKERHFLTGKLIDDIATDVEVKKGGFVVSYLTYKYGVYLNNGVTAARIPYTRGSGAARSLYIEGLMKYVRLRMGISDEKTVKSVAFAIATEQKKRGMPLRTEGKGTKWADNANEAAQEQIGDLFEDLSETFIMQGLRDLAEKYNREAGNGSNN